MANQQTVNVIDTLQAEENASLLQQLLKSASFVSSSEAGEVSALCQLAEEEQLHQQWLDDLLPILDFVLLMSVNPGFSGQPFLPYTLEKARWLRRAVRERGVETEIEMDGGLGRGTIRSAVEAGVETCVAGSAVFGEPDPLAAMAELRRLALGERE